MKKIMIIIILVLMFTSSTYAFSTTPRYKIISSSLNDQDIKEMYEVKEKLLKDYRRWSEGVDDLDQVLVDHCNEYDAVYENHTYLIILGEGKGKSIEGDLKVNYCESSKEIQKKSLIVEIFHLFQ